MDQIHAAEQSDPAADVSAQEAAIDQIIYKLYNLTRNDIKLLETTTHKENKNNTK